MANTADAGFEESMAITRMMMRAVGVWPLDKDVVWPMCKFLALMLPLWFLNIMPQTGKAIQEHANFSLMLDVITTADINEFIAFIKTLTLWYYSDEMKRLIESIYIDWKKTSAEEQREMWTTARTSKWILRFFTLSSFGTIIMYTVVYFINYESNIIYVNETIFRPLYLKSYFPFETHRSPIYEIISFGQCLGATLSVIGFAAYDGLYVSSILHYSSQFYNLKRRMENLVQEHRLTKISFAKCLKPIIQRHLHLINLADVIEDSFNKTFLVQVFMLSIALCLQGYQFVMLFSEIGAGNALMVFTIFFTAANLGSIFAYCAIAQIIRDDSLSLLDALYQMEWYDLPAKDAVMIVIVMGRCIRPIELTVGKFSPLTLEYFTGVMKTSVGYLSVLLAVKDKVID